MSIVSKLMVVAVVMVSLMAGGCGSKGGRVDNLAGPAPANKAAVQPNKDGTIPSGTGVEKEKPAAGKANVQGKAFYDEKPAVGVQVKLCKTFSQYMNGCGGETFTTKTDDAGEYLIKDVPPGMYEGLTVQVFDTPFYVFATAGFISAAKYNIEDGKTYFAPDTNLFKNDLKLVNPKAGSKVAAAGIEVKWDAYPDAAYYKFSIHADSSSGAETNYDYINKRVDGTSASLDKPLAPGNYTAKVEAFNANDRKLSQTSQDMKFTVTGAPAAK
ncbi:MAG: carboxypeptidase-like regulatory domain-containing protein [Pyrinomonadaceae bacterium]